MGVGWSRVDNHGSTWRERPAALTFEFSGLTFLVLISGSVVTILFHHSILLIWEEEGAGLGRMF